MWLLYMWIASQAQYQIHADPYYYCLYRVGQVAGCF